MSEVMAEAVETEVNIEPTEAQETEADVSANEEVPEAEEVEVDYKSRSEELEQTKKTDQEKINKQRAALSQTNNKIEELQNQLNKLQVKAAPKEPSIDDYETHDEYVDALVNFRTDTQLKTKQEEFINNQKNQLEQQKIQTEQTEFLKVEHTYRQANPDYDAAKTELQSYMGSTQRNTAVDDAIYQQASRDGMLPAMINYFGSNNGENLNEFETISAMSPVEAAVEVYKIQQRLKVDVTPKQNKPLPKPTRGVKGTSKANKPLAQRTGKDVLDWVNS